MAGILSGAGILTSDKALSFCEAYGISVARFEVSDDPKSAVGSAERLGYPVALKALAPELVHKSDVGGVALGLRDAAALRQEAQGMLTRIGHPARLMVQRMMSGGVELIVGGKRDRAFGPVVMLGMGGIFVEVFDDVAFRVAPITQADADGMVEEIRGNNLLKGTRGQPPLDRAAVSRALTAISRILTENPTIDEIDVNPLLVLENGVVALDARVAVKQEQG